MSSDFMRFVKAYYQSRGCQVNGEADEVFAVVCADNSVQEYTFDAALARERKVPLLARGSAAFQQILKDCQEDGALCQVILKPKTNQQDLLSSVFCTQPADCTCCGDSVQTDNKTVCLRAQPCQHTINNGAVAAVKITKTEPAKFLQFHYSAVFHSRLRSKNEENVVVLVEEKTGAVQDGAFLLEDFGRLAVVAEDAKGKIKVETYGNLKVSSEEKVREVLGCRLSLFDLPLCRVKKAKLKAFERRLRRERREHVISKKHDFDYLKWQNDYEALLKREEESYATSVSVKFTNLLVVNTQRIKAQVTLDNGAAFDVQFTLGLQPNIELACPICKQPFTAGYATKDGFYVCGGCVRQSVDSGKLYSKKAHLTVDEKLGEPFEADAGFLCAVCGKKFSRLQEFRCSHDGSSVCLSHFDLCDDCGKVFSKNNLSYTDEFKHHLCPKHAKTGGKTR